MAHGNNERVQAFGWIPDTPDDRDIPYGLAQQSLEAPADLPASIDLRPDMPPLDDEHFNQGTTNSCTAHALAAAFQYDRWRQHVRAFWPSRLFIYYNERVMRGQPGEDGGGSLRDGITSIARDGVCFEEDWPFDLGNLFSQPDQAAYAAARKYTAVQYFALNNANLNELKACLAARFPFVFGFDLYDSFYQGDQGGYVPAPAGPQRGRHAVCAVGYDDASQVFIIRNSWGPGKGDNGFYYMPYDYLTSNLCRDFWTIRLVTNAAFF